MNRSFILLIIIAFSILLNGCWNYKELNSIHIVSGLAIDKGDKNRYEVSVEVVNIKDTDMESNIESQIIESESNAIFDAIRDMIRISSKKLYFGHATTLILSEEIAREGILPALEWIVRDQEPRLGIEVFVSRGNTAKEILQSQSLATDIRLYELDTMVSQNGDLIEIPTFRIHEIINKLDIPKTHFVLPTVRVESIHDKLTNILSGGAVFDKDRLVGFLENRDIKPYLFIKNKVKGGLINVHNMDSPEEAIILEIFHSKTKLDYEASEGGIRFDINVMVEVSIAELNTRLDYLTRSGRLELKEISEEYLKTDIENIIKKVQREFGLDIFGFGNFIRERNPKLWKEIEGNWDLIFQDLDVNVDCDIEFRNSGHFSRPIEVSN